MSNFKVGDIVIGISDSYTITGSGSINKVLDIDIDIYRGNAPNGARYMEVECLRGCPLPNRYGEKWEVLMQYFIKLDLGLDLVLYQFKYGWTDETIRCIRKELK